PEASGNELKSPPAGAIFLKATCASTLASASRITSKSWRSYGLTAHGKPLYCRPWIAFTQSSRVRESANVRPKCAHEGLGMDTPLPFIETPPKCVIAGYCINLETAVSR